MAVVKGGYNLINLQNKDLATGSFTIPGIYDSIDSATKRTVLTNIVVNGVELKDREVNFFVVDGNYETSFPLSQTGNAIITITPEDVVSAKDDSE